MIVNNKTHRLDLEGCQLHKLLAVILEGRGTGISVVLKASKRMRGVFRGFPSVVLALSDSYFKNRLAELSDTPMVTKPSGC